MGDPRIEKFKTVVAVVNEVLYKQWNPIGFDGELPQDEYETYAIRVVSMLAAGAEVNELAAYLASIGSSLTGNAITESSCLPVATRLVAFREAARGIPI